MWVAILSVCTHYLFCRLYSFIHALWSAHTLRFKYVTIFLHHHKQELSHFIYIWWKQRINLNAVTKCCENRCNSSKDVSSFSVSLKKEKNCLMVSPRWQDDWKEATWLTGTWGETGQWAEVNERANRGWWMMKEWFSSFSPPLVFILRLSFVIGGGPFFRSCDSQLQIMRRQMEGPVTQIEMGCGEVGGGTKASISCLMSLPGASSALSAPGWCWQMELLDTNPSGTVAQKYETEKRMSVKDERRNEWRLTYQTI